MSEREIWFRHLGPYMFFPVHWKGLAVWIGAYVVATLGAAAGIWLLWLIDQPTWTIVPFAPYAIATIFAFFMAYRHSPRWRRRADVSAVKKEQQ